MRNEAESPVPTPVLTGSGSTGLLYQHLRQCHPAGSVKVNTSATLIMLLRIYVAALGCYSILT